MLRSIGKQSGESVQSVRKMKRKGYGGKHAANIRHNQYCLPNHPLSEKQYNLNETVLHFTTKCSDILGVVDKQPTQPQKLSTSV